MISGKPTKSIDLLRPACQLLTLSILGILPLGSVNAQGFGFGFGVRQGVVGGVSIDAEGQLRSASRVEQGGLLQELRQSLSGPNDQAAQPSQLRMISLTKLQQEISAAITENRSLSEEILYLAGIQRIQYIFAVPEKNDIIIAGPAEGWRIREDAAVVGETTGRPVIQLEDFLVALRTARATRQQTISVSIDPTPEGQVRLNRMLGQLRTGPGFDPRRIEDAMCKAFGPQVVSITAVPEDSRMASTLVAADYRMKRLAMNLEDSPVAGLPSYLEMIKDSGASMTTQPRWWIASNYNAILHSEDNLAWKLSGSGVKAMTEEEFVTATGRRRQTGQTDGRAQKWADLFTEKFEQLCAANSAFGDLRNAIDLNIIATIIEAYEFERVAGCDLRLLTDSDGQLQTPSWKTPRTVAPQCSFVRGRAGWTVSASGGVEINPWRMVAEQSKPDAGIAAMHVQTASSGDHWWWD